MRSAGLFVVLQHREHVEAGKLRPAIEEFQFYREGRAHHFAAEFPDEAQHRPARAAGREQVIAQQDVLPRAHGVLVNFKLVRAIFELDVTEAVFHGSFLGLRTGTNPAPEPVGQRRRENESARLDSGDDVDFSPGVVLAELVDQRVKSLLILEQGRQVVEQGCPASDNRESRGSAFSGRPSSSFVVEVRCELGRDVSAVAMGLQLCVVLD